ncbi:MAG: acetyl-CoA carboxylase biotin carboxyl carrier protein [Verrucomicrobiota bacterium]
MKEIKAVIDLMTRNGLSEFELEKPEFKIRVKKGGQPGDVLVSAPMPLSYSAPAPQQASVPAVAPVAESTGLTINSPMVGTFYRSPSPDSPSYAEVGKEVGPDTVVCIIEAMKVMNEVKGVITEILAENGKPVEFGKPLFKVRPN